MSGKNSKYFMQHYDHGRSLQSHKIQVVVWHNVRANMGSGKAASFLTSALAVAHQLHALVALPLAHTECKAWSPHIQSGCFGEDKNHSSLTRIEPQII
jgi:hypothetical protein